MKRIGLLTIHHSYNYGGALQAYATYYTLKKICSEYDIEFIDYENSTFINRRKIFLPISSFGNVVRNIRNLLHYSKLLARKRKFERFYSGWKKSSRHWVDHINWEDTDYDLVIVGSDQTLSLYLTGNPAEMKPFFLEGLKSCPRFAFSSSMGEEIERLTESEKKWISHELRNFNYLSVREEKAAQFIKNILGKRPEVTLDPTLLLTSNDWNEIIPEGIPEQSSYIAFYTVLSSYEVIEYVKRLSILLNKPVYALHSPTRFEITQNFKYFDNLSPTEFIGFIKNAYCVVTTSFHATVFSIIYHKQFQSLVLKEGNRLKTLLEMMKLNSRLIVPDNWDEINNMMKPINYTESDVILNSARQKSLTVLKTIVDYEGE